MTKHIPNFITLCNLACGCIGVVAVFNGDLFTGSLMIWVGALFDFLDGFAARMLKKFSPIGKDLDSLADIVTFCFLPSTILFVMIQDQTKSTYLPYVGFLLVLFGALRLAKFNNDTRQSDSFYGLPVPASAIFISALPFISANLDIPTFLTGTIALITIAVLLSLLMVSDIKLMSLKFKNFSFQANWQRYLLLASALVLLIILHIQALPIVIIIYLVLSIALKSE